MRRRVLYRPWPECRVTRLRNGNNPLPGKILRVEVKGHRKEVPIDEIVEFGWIEAVRRHEERAYNEIAFRIAKRFGVKAPLYRVVYCNRENKKEG